MEDNTMRDTKKILLSALLFGLLLCAVGCGKETDVTPSQTPTEAAGVTNTPEATPTEAPKTMEEQMIAASLMSTGNNIRFKKFLEKVRAGEDVTVAYLGGSITEGYNAGTKEIYAKLVTDYIRMNYGTGGEVNYVNAGLSGTPSILGLIRSDRDIFVHEPDLLFIEFAVNDGQSAIDNTGLESLIYKGLTQENEPAVILLYSVTEDGYTCQDNMNIMAFHYGIPCVSVKKAIWPFIESGEYTWGDWSNDGSHPNADGMQLYSKFIIHLMNTLDAEEPDNGFSVPTNFVKGFNHSGLKMVDRVENSDRITITSTGSFGENRGHNAFPNSWLASGEENEAFTFTFTGSSLYIVYKDTTDAAYGAAEVYIDGEYCMSVYGNSKDGWNNPVTERVFREKESAEHTVEIRMKAEDVGKKFNILAFGVVE